LRSKLQSLLDEVGLNDPRVDDVSHYILRLSFCQSEDLRRWFLQHECYLFQHRLQELSESQLLACINQYMTNNEQGGGSLKPIRKDEKDRLQESLLQLGGMTPTEFMTTSFYAVPFVQALDLVATRQCYLQGGYAYVPQNKVLSIVVNKFRTQLSHSLALLAGAGTFRSMDDPEAVRVFPMLKNLNQCLVHREPTEGLEASGQHLTASNIDQHVGNMPLCMRLLHKGMTNDHKLRHWGRLQYGLFLKGAGLSMEDALAFFQRHFKSVTGEVFQKQYAYNIRHMYGKEGKRATYTAYSCAKILHGNAPSAGDHHGCPFRHYDADHLSNVLQRLQIGTSADRATIVSLKQSHQYQLACQKHFEIMHPNAVSQKEVNLDNVGNHPNAWFRASMAYHDTKKTSGSLETTTPSKSDVVAVKVSPGAVESM